MRDHSNHICKGRREAIVDLFAKCGFSPRTESVPLEDALGLTVAETLKSVHSLPNKPTSKMDAIAVRFDEVQGLLEGGDKWELGRDFQFCNTGVAVPDGFDTAIAVEAVSWDGDDVVGLVRAPKTRGEGINETASTIKEGVVLVEKGTRLKPAHLALLAMGGHTEVPVIAPPRVAFIPTGSELVAAQANPPLGKNIDSNSYNIMGKLIEWGAEPVMFEIVKDGWDNIESALKEAAETCDIVVINAGSSKGSEDYTCEILEKDGEVLSHETNIAPGKHASCSILNGKPVIGISGPPMAADLNSIMFVKPIVEGYLTGELPTPAIAWAKLSEDVDKPRKPGMNLARRVRLYFDDAHELCAQVFAMEAPVLKDCAESDGVLVVPAGSEGILAGTLVPIEVD